MHAQLDEGYDLYHNRASITFSVLTDEDLSTNVFDKWTGPSYDKSNPQSVNEVLRNVGEAADGTNYESGFIDLRNIHNLYISSPNLGSFSTLGPRGESNIIKKVPVSSEFGYSILDSVVAAHDYIDVSKQQLTTLEFKLSDVRGNVVPLHGSYWSFSIVLSTLNENM